MTTDLMVKNLYYVSVPILLKRWCMEKRSILIVEDEQIAAQDLKESLQSFGYHVRDIAKSGEQAIRMVDAEIPDLILMDLHLAGKLSGIEAAGQILARHAVPIIYVTAYSNPELTEQAKRTRPYGYIIKPYDERLIRTEIEIAMYKFGLDQNFRREYAKLEEWVQKRTGELAFANEALRKSEARLDLALRSAEMGVWNWDIITGMRYFDDQTCHLLGIDPATFSGTVEEFFSIIHPEDREMVKEALSRTLEQDVLYEPVYRAVWPDGSIRFITARGTLEKDTEGRPVRINGLIWDTTDRKRAEEALVLASKKLNLLSSITRHDIRNQLTALHSYIQLSEEAVDNPVEMRAFIAREEKVAEAISRQISFTKDYEDLGVKAAVWQDVSMLVRIVAETLPMGKTALEIDCPGLFVFADPLLEKVFYNLIDNALRYGGDAMTTIRVTADVQGEVLHIVVEDNGSGVSDEDKKRLFMKGFGRNTGLGLFLSREILSITGISIIENGEPGKGARFEITVPKGTYRSRMNRNVSPV